ncbi:hypothetical protein OG709_33505 [Streptomyces sp. NBC_01267]|uniref:hypothetical protein n=1 Tax=Streptomyces sp. NBC_01267 TaxID=2903805 RepID=UPI002E336143|nr:hypothetical protein [Streptomyces sp. NBC_01267]
MVRVVLDLHRHVLLRHLELGVPRDPAAERRLWDDLTQFYLHYMPFVPAQVVSPGVPSGPPTP